MNEELTEVARELGARIFALQAVLVAVIRTHPHPNLLAPALAAAEDAGLANMLYLWPDEAMNTYRATVASLRGQIPPG